MPFSSFARLSALPDEDIIPTLKPLEDKCLAASAPIPVPDAINNATFSIYKLVLPRRFTKITPKIINTSPTKA